MEIIVPDQIIMGLILYAGDAKQHIYKALDYIKMVHVNDVKKKSS